MTTVEKLNFSTDCTCCVMIRGPELARRRTFLLCVGAETTNDTPSQQGHREWRRQNTEGLAVTKALKHQHRRHHLKANGALLPLGNRLGLASWQWPPWSPSAWIPSWYGPKPHSVGAGQAHRKQQSGRSSFNV